MLINKRISVAIFISFLLVLSACGRLRSSYKTAGGSVSTVVPTNPQATSTPAMVLPPTVEGTLVHQFANNCELLDSHDLASLYSSAEVVLPNPVDNQVDRPIFSTQIASGKETSCTYYVFHKPGSKDMEMLQVTVWIDLPLSSAISAWEQVWADARSKAFQPVSGIGEEAFYQGGRLTFKQRGNYYVTLEVSGTKIDTSTSAGIAQQIEIEKSLALRVAERLR